MEFLEVLRYDKLFMVWSLVKTTRAEGVIALSKRGEKICKRKDGRWEAHYREAKEKQAHKISEGIRKLSGNQKNPLFAEVAELWMENNRLKVKASTSCRYQALLEAHIIPDLGGRRIAMLTGTEINAYLADKLLSGRIDKKGGLSPAYVRSIMLIIHAIMTFATEHQLRPPLQTKICKPQMLKQDLRILSPGEQSRIVSQCRRQLDPTAIGILLSLYAGLRIGEICALEWTDMDLTSGIIHIRKTVARVRIPGADSRTMLVLEPPKTASSRRDIPLCSRLIPLLNLVRSQSLSDFVVSSTPQFVSPRTYDYRYHRLLKLAEVQSINYHALRHTFATRCIEAGTDVKSLSEMLGHANAAVTLNTYVHPSMEIKRAQVEKLIL